MGTSRRPAVILVFAFAACLGGFGMLTADAANPVAFVAVVNPLSQLPASGSPAASPTALSCVSASSCLDLGDHYLIHGNPASWSQASAIPMTGANIYLSRASCRTRTFCVAVGTSLTSPARPTVLVGNPSTWGAASARSIPFKYPASLSAVACSSKTSCVAVGQTYSPARPLIFTGNPAKWTRTNATVLRPKPHGGALNSVACTSATACVAVGYVIPRTDLTVGAHEEPMFLAGNPASWKTASVKEINLGARPRPAGFGPEGTLSSVACTLRTYCVAVGAQGDYPEEFSSTVFAAGNPAKWNLKRAFSLKAPSATGTTVTGIGFAPWSVSCDHARFCVAAGWTSKADPVYIAGNPTTWKGGTLARPAQNGPSFLGGSFATASCAPRACFAGGAANGGDFLGSFSGG